MGFSSPIRQIDPGAFHASAEDDRRLAVHANDAGVALDIIHTMGTAQAGPGSIEATLWTMSSQQVSTESGGQFTSVRTAAQQLARLDGAKIDPSTLSLAQAEGRWTGGIDLMILCIDPQAKVVGSVDQHMNLSMSPALYEQARTSGIPYTATVPVTGSVRRVKVIVYNYDSDRLGVASVVVK